ncbi:MAG TPA: proton-conducting transporter membrane subunit, partial [Clostridia bacterium]|nr:proton-conducting transporter membrane subunit [Clostridia bacterium]
YNVFGSSLIKELSINRLLLLLGMVAIIAGSLLAIIQDELKRRLAYSTVAQVGYLFVGLGFLNVQGLTGTLLYLAGHAICKSILFLAAGAIISATGKERVSELGGVGRKMPLTMAAFTLASLGLIGIPLLPGFIGKWHLISGSLTAGKYLPVVVIIIGSVLCAVYLLPLVRTAYFAPAANAHKGWKDPPPPQKAALVFLMAVALFFGMFPEFFLRFAERAAVELLSII